MPKSLTNIQKWLLIITLIVTFFLIYVPHLDYPFPFHVDEWHHISEGMRLGDYGAYFDYLQESLGNRFSGVEIGFHFFLFLLSFIFDLVLLYKFFPATWACFSVLALFYVIYKKSDHNFLLAWLGVLFFLSIKSNVNILGLWFFTPLTFSIPFVFLYVYFLTEGIEKQNKKSILISAGIVVFLIPTHAVSVLFLVPPLLVYLAVHYKYLVKEYKFFLNLLLIPWFAFFFYQSTLALSWHGLIGSTVQYLKFEYGWGVLELKHSLPEIYNWLGYVFAFVGVFYIFKNKEVKKYLFYLLWPLLIFTSIFLYRLTGISFLTPYQRNLYYFVIGMPILSALGLYYLFSLIGQEIAKLKISSRDILYIKKAIYVGLIFVVAIVLFSSYYNLPNQVDLYHIIDDNDYEALKFLATMPSDGVVATGPLILGAAVYPVSGHSPLATLIFYGKYEDKVTIHGVFKSQNCEFREEVIKEAREDRPLNYLIVKGPNFCNWPVLFKKGNTYIYDLNEW